MEKFIPLIKPMTIKDFEHNALRIEVKHDKSEKAIVCRVDAVKYDFTTGGSNFTMVLMTSPNTTIKIIPMPRLNAKKVVEEQKSAAIQFESKSGLLYEMVKDWAKKKDMEIEESLKENAA